MSSTPNILDRKVNVVELSIPVKPGVSKYRLRGHKTLDGAFVGTVAMMEAESGIQTRSPGLRVSGRNRTMGETIRGYTRIALDPDEFTALSPSLPTDRETLFLRVEDFDLALGGYLPPGQILIVPPADYFGVQNSTISLFGTAPGLSALPGEYPPLGAMSFGLPLYSTSGEITNLDGADALLVSFGEGQLMASIPAGGSFPIDDGSVIEVFLASASGNPIEFSASFSLTKV